MTPTVAKTKWCPFAEIAAAVSSEGAAVGAAPMNRNDDGTIPTAGKCLATDCMLWAGDDNDGTCAYTSTAVPGLSKFQRA